MHLLLIILVILLLVGAFPVYPYNASWGYPPFGLVLLILILILILG